MNSISELTQVKDVIESSQSLVSICRCSGSRSYNAFFLPIAIATLSYDRHRHFKRDRP
jgi:hypothetical protein